MRHTPPRREQAGFTLIELLVAIGIILFLAALAVRFLPTAYNEGREANAAASVQGWFDLAKQKALRDQAPRGIRLWIDPTTTLQVTEAEFIEQPDPYTGDAIYSDPNDLRHVYFDPQGKAPVPDVCNGQLAPNPVTQTYDKWYIQPGDILQLFGGQSYLVRDYQNMAPWPNHVPLGFKLNPEVWPWPLVGVVQRVQAELNTPLAMPIPSPGNTNYRILRQPRPIGDEKLQLPEGIVIDLAANALGSPFTNPATLYPWNQLPIAAGQTPPYLDIMFAPSGQVVLPQISNESINLWVRGPDPLNPGDYFAGNPTIIAIFVRTGFVAAFAPDSRWAASNNNPYTDVK